MYDMSYFESIQEKMAFEQLETFRVGSKIAGETAWKYRRKTKSYSGFARVGNTISLIYFQ